MAETTDHIDLFVRPLVQLGGARIWLVCRKEVSHCVGCHDTEGEATIQARRIADYEVLMGRAAQVHLQEQDGGDWKTVWYSAGSVPRYSP